MPSTPPSSGSFGFWVPVVVVVVVLLAVVVVVEVVVVELVVVVVVVGLVVDEVTDEVVVLEVCDGSVGCINMLTRKAQSMTTIAIKTIKIAVNNLLFFILVSLMICD